MAVEVKELLEAGVQKNKQKILLLKKLAKLTCLTSQKDGQVVC